MQATENKWWKQQCYLIFAFLRKGLPLPGRFHGIVGALVKDRNVIELSSLAVNEGLLFDCFLGIILPSFFSAANISLLLLERVHSACANAIAEENGRHESDEW